MSESKTTEMHRNLHPHAEAILAMTIWGKDYARQRGGSMDFYDKLCDAHKNLCRDVVLKIKEARREQD